MYASENGHLVVVELLLDRGADPNAATYNGYTALMWAAGGNHPHVVEILLERGADLDYSPGFYKVTPLSSASGSGHIDMVKLLLDRGANPSAGAPVIAASYKSHLEVAKVLAVRGADLAARDNRHGTASENAGRLGNPAFAAFIDAVIRWPPLQIAVACRAPADLCALLRAGRIATAGCRSCELVSTATNPAELWPGQPPVCAATVQLAKRVLSKWAPANHALVHARFRAAVRMAMLTSHRLARAARRPNQCALPVLPMELWLTILGELRRSDWEVARW